MSRRLSFIGFRSATHTGGADSVLAHVSSRTELKIWQSMLFLWDTAERQAWSDLIPSAIPLAFTPFPSSGLTSAMWVVYGSCSASRDFLLRCIAALGVWHGAIFPNSHVLLVGWDSFSWTCQQSEVRNCLHLLCRNVPVLKMRLSNKGPL